MNLTREILVDRRTALENRYRKEMEKRDEAYSEASKLLANINGAVQDCDHWLSVIEAEDKAAEAAKQLPEGKLVEMSKPTAAAKV